MSELAESNNGSWKRKDVEYLRGYIQENVGTSCTFSCSTQPINLSLSYQAQPWDGQSAILETRWTSYFSRCQIQLWYSAGTDGATRIVVRSQYSNGNEFGTRRSQMRVRIASYYQFIALTIVCNCQAVLQSWPSPTRVVTGAALPRQQLEMWLKCIFTGGVSCLKRRVQCVRSHCRKTNV